MYDLDPKTGKINGTSPWQFVRSARRLRTPGGKTVTFPHPIGQLVACGDVAMVRLNAPSTFPRNVYGVGRDGNILWRLRQSPFADAGKRDTYDSIGRRKQGRLVWAHTWWGTLFDVDPPTGRIVREYWTK